MNLKTSLFSKMIVKSDLKRFWWVSALNTLAILMFAVYTIFERYLIRGNVFIPEAKVTFFNSPVFSVLMICVPILIIFGVFTAIMLSLYLNSANSVSFMHGMPIKRITHFASHFLSGIILITAPAFINAVIMLFMKLSPAASPHIMATHILKWLICYIMYALVVYSGTTFVTLITGNAFAAIGVTGCMAVLPLVVTGFLTVFFRNNIYGYYENEIYNWLQYIYIDPIKLLSPYCLIYIALIAVLITGTYFIYKIRNLENYGEVIAFPKLKPLFIYTVAVILGFLGYLYCEAVSGSSSIWWVLVFGLLGIVIAFMLSKKAFTLKGSLKPILIYTGFFAIFFCTVKFDITGYEKRVPDIAKIEGVSVTGGFDWNDETIYHPEIGNCQFLETYHPVLTENEDIKNIVELHRYMIKNRKISPQEDCISLPICYKLESGREICRRYTVPRKSCETYLKKIFETKEMKANDFNVTDKTQKEIIFVNVYDSRSNSSLKIYENEKELINRLSEAFKKDIENLKYEDNYIRNRFVRDGNTNITFSYYKPVKALSGKQLTEEQMKLLSSNSTYTINENYVNTMAILNEKGFFDLLPKKENIKAAGISLYADEPSESNAIYSSTSDSSYIDPDKDVDFETLISSYQYKTENPDEAWELYEFVVNEAIYDTNYGFNHINIAFLTDKGTWMCTLNYNENMPEIIKKILKD